VRTSASLRDAWDVVSATQVVNRASGLRPFRYTDHPQEDGTSRRTFETLLKGLSAEGEEFTATWEYPRLFDIRRTYTKGPFVSVIHRVEIEPDGSGSLIRASFWLVPRGFLGKIFSRGFAKEVVPAMRSYVEKATSPAGLLEAMPEVEVSPTRPHRASIADIGKVDALVQRAKQLYDSKIIDVLGQMVLTYPDEMVSRLRPLALARAWGTDRWETVDACLAATSVGLLMLRWDVICPHCRGDRANLASLHDVKKDGWCPSCNLAFDINLDKALEVVFLPHSDIRKVERETYCQAGPGTTPHVRYQRVLGAGEEWSPQVDVEPGRYRVRISGTDSVCWIRVDPDAEPLEEEPTIYVTDEGIADVEPVFPPGGPTRVTIRNRSRRSVVAIIEDARWGADALTGSELITDQRFRDLFSNQMLAGGVTLAVQTVTLLFTDIVGSTAMYHDLGDAKAFKLVWSHFEILTATIRDNHGATVKTIGDAVMAAFHRPGDALAAAHELHERLAAWLGEMDHEDGLQLRVGLHEGSCIVVTLNDQLDYFGQTVNTAARVGACGEGGDIVVTRHVAALSEGCEVLRNLDWHCEPFERQLKGMNVPLSMLRFKRLE
jgi:class 3 adenylate cyclase